jgi:hypothetical protein
MRAELLYTAEHGYDSEPVAVSLYDGAFVQAYGRGSGTVEWGGSPGTVEWSNLAAERPDGVGLPAVSGVIRVEGRPHPVLFELSGLARPSSRAGRRLIGAAVRWWTDDPDLGYLNDVVGFEEGEIDMETGRITTRAYALHPEA